MSAASVIAYASTTHCRPVSPALSSRWMLGSATFTIVMSTSSMNVVAHTATSVQRRSWRASGKARRLLLTPAPRQRFSAAERGQRLARLEQRLQAADHEHPPAGDARGGLRRGLELV